MKTVYGRINNDLYEMEIYNHAIVAKKVDSLPTGAEWESAGDYIHEQLPTSAILQVLRFSEFLFREEDFEKIRKSGQVKEILPSEIINRYWRGISANRVKFNFEKLDELLARPCRVLFNFRAIVVLNDNAIALYDPL